MQTKIKCSHDGYKRLRGGPIHSRKWIFDANQLTIYDFIDRRFKEVEAHFFFHPEVEVKLDESGKKGTASIDNKIMITFNIQQGFACILNTTYHPEFGLSISNKCLVIKLDELKSKVCFSW